MRLIVVYIIFTILISSCEVSNVFSEYTQKEIDANKDSIFIYLPPPNFSEFQTKVYSHPEEIKLAFIELEPLNSQGFELTSDKIDLLMEETKTIFEEVSNGKTRINPEYTIFTKKSVDVEVVDSVSWELDEFVGEIVQENKNKNFDFVIIVVDAPRSHFVGANWDSSIHKPTPIIYNGDALFQFLDKNIISSTKHSYGLVHEMLHSYEYGDQKDAYTNFGRGNETIPFITYRDVDLFGPSSSSHPFSPIKVQNGWGDFNVINLGVEESFTFRVENSCKNNKFVKIPQGFVLSDKNEILEKSIVFDLRGMNDCEEDIISPGLYVYQVYQSNDFIEYSYDIPPTCGDYENTCSPQRIFSLEYHGQDYEVLNNIIPGPLTNFENEDFEINILSESINSGIFESVDVEIELNRKESLDPDFTSSIYFELLTYGSSNNSSDNPYIIAIPKFEDDKIIPSHKLSINGEEIYHSNLFQDDYPNLKPNSMVQCIVYGEGSYDLCTNYKYPNDFDSAISDNSNISPIGNVEIIDIKRYPQIYESCKWELSLNNGVQESSINITNPLNLDCI